MSRLAKPLRFASIVVVIYLGAANAWWHYRNYDIVSDSLVGPLLAWLAHQTNFLWVPGRGLIYVLHDGPATSWSDFLIPVLSSLLWGWVAVFALRLVEYGRSNERWAELTRVAKFRFGAECALVLSILTCWAGMYRNSDPLYLTGFFASCVMIVAALALSVYSSFPRSASSPWLKSGFIRKEC
jgi:hypothetical protein